MKYQQGGSSAVGNFPSTLNATSRYDDFLFAPICEEADGMRLSVLSALARLNVDPWEEATHLAAMPRSDAERMLVSTLDLVSGRKWIQSEAAIVAARLVRLLPQKGDGATSAATEIAGVRAERTNYWLMGLWFAMAVSFIPLHDRAPTTKADGVTSVSAAAPSLKSGTANNGIPGSKGQTD